MVCDSRRRAAGGGVLRVLTIGGVTGLRHRAGLVAHPGEHVPDARLSASVAEYARGLHEAADDARPLRWLLIFVLVVAVATAGWDAVFGSGGNLVASGVYLTALAAELLWWPGRRHRLLANADLAASPG